jgi:hypothetical protein
MRYDRASKGGKPSASQWNGFLQMHKDYYGANASQGLIPPLLQNSVIAPASLKDGSEDIGPFQPVRIVKNVNFRDVVGSLPSYEVEPVDEAGTDKHGNYGFTLGEGCSASAGGRIVVSGIALVQMDAGELYYNKVVSPSRGQHEGSFDSSYYVVPDNTLSLDDKLIAPTGHFKLLSWYDPVEIGKFEEADKVYVALDMGQRPTSFLAKVDATIAASTEASEVITMSSGTAYAYYGVSESTAATGDMEVQKDEDAYEIEVYNTSAEAIPSGDHLLSYSLEYNRFIVLVAGGQTVKIGKADADIAVDATGTISIWRDGADTTENETAKLDWMAGTTQVSSGKEVLITWFADEGIWRITGAECE